MALKFRVAFLGFTEFERTALGSYFRLANREPRYVLVQMLTDADFLVADADHGPSVQLVAATDRMAETVFIGSQAPPGAVAWMTRPIDALHVMRELDAMVTVQRAAASEHAGGGTRVVPRRRPMQLPPAPLPAPPAPGAPETTAEEPPPLHLREDLRPPASESLLERSLSVPPPPPPMSRRMAAAKAAAALAQSSLESATPQPPRALIVDDSAIAQRYLEIRLLRWGLVVDRADTSARANDLMLRHSYDLVFLDVELGPDSELDGLALCQQIKQSVAAMNVSVIMISAHHTELDRVRGALAGCDAYLAKPLDQAELDRLLLRQGLVAPSAVRKKYKRAAAAP